MELGGPKESNETMQATFTLVVPRWGDPRRSVPTAASVAAVELRPCQAAGRFGPQPATPKRNERVFALLELMLCKNPSVPQLCSNCPEARSPQTPWRWLVSSLQLSPHERVGLRDTAGRAAPSACVSNDCKLQAPSFRAAQTSTDSLQRTTQTGSPRDAGSTN